MEDYVPFRMVYKLCAVDYADWKAYSPLPYCTVWMTFVRWNVEGAREWEVKKWTCGLN